MVKLCNHNDLSRDAVFRPQFLKKKQVAERRRSVPVTHRLMWLKCLAEPI